MSFVVKHGDRSLHHNFVVALLNDLFGIQARGGCSCAGPYGHRLLHIDGDTSAAIQDADRRRVRGGEAGLGSGEFQLLHRRDRVQLHSCRGGPDCSAKVGSSSRTTRTIRPRPCGVMSKVPMSAPTRLADAQLFGDAKPPHSRWALTHLQGYIEEAEQIMDAGLEAHRRHPSVCRGGGGPAVVRQSWGAFRERRDQSSEKRRAPSPSLARTRRPTAKVDTAPGPLCPSAGPVRCRTL